MRVEQILRKKGTKVVTVRMNESLQTAAQLMRRENIGAVVVKDVCGTEGEVVVGMLSERDILRAVADRGASALALPASVFMSRPVISCGPGDTLDAVQALMDEHHIRHVPVLDEHTLIGVLSIRDVLGAELGGARETVPLSSWRSVRVSTLGASS
ncbi:CBS domain-containing protein [Propylenella binzhouense]|uniref:CBS domain-containing protein n=1 Tax=Propylenella binzhouense TaxID=2555902 RepID=A0A964T4A6_9HYPH|nr:CBS domain-containing protein [Propylenella binzhouense]MYZ48178.1 CBS domain-containing protein [Propylenella binzhouense]